MSNDGYRGEKEEIFSEDRFYKENPGDAIWRVSTPGKVGQFLFSFDKKNVFSLFSDYPYKLTPEQKRIFDKQFPYWAKFFAPRTKK